jgi:hypothetical protein
MAKVFVNNAMVLVNSVDRSAQAYAIDIQSTRADIDVSSFGDTAIERILGLADVTVTVSFWNDYQAAALDSQLQALHVGSTSFPVEFRPVNAARSTSNPAYVLAGAWLAEYHPLNFDMGSAASTDVTFLNAAQTGLQRLTA